MSVKMTALRPFTNPKVEGPRSDGSIVPGDAFATDWMHARDLRRVGLAEPVDAAALDVEPAEALQPDNQIDEPELRRINARRQGRVATTAGDSGAASSATGDAAKPQAVTGAVVKPTAVAGAVAPAPVTVGVQAAAPAGSAVKSNVPVTPPAAADATKP